MHPYLALPIATGSRPFVPPIPGLDAAHVFVFRTLEDCERIRTAAAGARTAVVLGDGLLGQLEAAAGAVLQERIEKLGITVRVGAKAVSAYDDATGCGVVPNAAIARKAGLESARGIIVNDGLQTSDRSIFAIRECAQHRVVTYGLVEPLWQNRPRFWPTGSRGGPSCTPVRASPRNSRSPA